MDARIYEIISLALRYLFALLALWLLLSAQKVVRRDQRIDERMRRELEKAGHMGNLRVLSGAGRAAKVGTYFELGRETSIGRSARCDISLRHKSLASHHARLEAGDGFLFITRTGRASIYINDQKVQKARSCASSGDHLTFGNIEFLLSLYDAPTHPLPPPMREEQWDEEDWDEDEEDEDDNDYDEEYDEDEIEDDEAYEEDEEDDDA